MTGPPNFDWVEARSKCTLEATFEQLKVDVQKDFDRLAELKPGLSQSCTIGTCSQKIFYVERDKGHRVVFEVGEEAIVIERWDYRGDSVAWSVELSVRLDDGGNCVLVDQDEKAWWPWQVRRRALEDTLFQRARV